MDDVLIYRGCLRRSPLPSELSSEQQTRERLAGGGGGAGEGGRELDWGSLDFALDLSQAVLFSNNADIIAHEVTWDRVLCIHGLVCVVSNLAYLSHPDPPLNASLAAAAAAAAAVATRDPVCLCSTTTSSSSTRGGPCCWPWRAQAPQLPAGNVPVLLGDPGRGEGGGWATRRPCCCGQ
jgi:hypothetical protein